MPDRQVNTYDHSRAGCTYADSDSGAVTGHFYGYLVITDAVLSAVTAKGDAVTDISKLVGPTLPAGLYDPVEIGSITVSSGLIKLLTEPS
jgi:hypothetical protein